MSRTHRWNPTYPVVLLAVAVVAAAAPGAAALSALTISLEPAAPSAGDVVYLTVREELQQCTVGASAVEALDGGVRVRLLPVVAPAAGGDGHLPCVSFDEPTTAFVVPEPGPWNVEVADSNGEPLTTRTLTVADGDPWNEEADPLRVEARPGPPHDFRLHAEGLWPHGGVPSLSRIEWRGQIVEVHFEGRAAGPAAITEWRFDGLIPGTGGDLFASSNLFSVVVFTDEPGFTGPREVSYVELPFCFGLGGDDPQLCLQGSRFRVRAWYRLAGGEEQRAQAEGLTADSGAFWFFRQDNLELLVKVLDGCAAFGRYWVFAAGLTNVGVRIEVTDTFSGETWTHGSEPGEGFDEVRDTDAFFC